MKYEFKRGNPEVPLREDQIDLIVEGFAKTLALRRAAGWAYVSAYHLKKWLLQGEEDHSNGKDTIHAQLFCKVAKCLSEQARQLIDKLRTTPKNYGALTWILEKCLKQDYGTESEEYKELVELYGKLFDSYKRLADNTSPSLQGEHHGESESEKLHSESD